MSEKLKTGGLERVIAAYKENPTPETVTGLWQEFWEEAGGRVGLELTVEDFPGAAEGLAEHLAAGDMPIYIPEGLASQEQRHLLGDMWPEMGSHSVQRGNRVSNEEVKSGWRYVEASLEAPYFDTTEAGLRVELVRRRRDGQNETEYIIGAQASKLLTLHYFDEETESRLLGSLKDGQVVNAYFSSGGNLHVNPDWNPQERHENLGGRSSEEV